MQNKLTFLKTNQEWKKDERTGNTLILEKQFVKFSDALLFIMRVGFIAERLNHHPTIENTYNRVKLSITTHDAGNTLTELDYAFANQVNQSMD